MRNRRDAHSIATALETIATGLLSVALDKVTRAKLMVRPRRTARASASTDDRPAQLENAKLEAE